MTPKLVDLDSLDPIPKFAGRPCSSDLDCQSKCYKGVHYGPEIYGAFDIPLEAKCPSSGQCIGYDSRFNVFTMCRIMFYDLLHLARNQAKIRESELSLAMALMDECGAPDPADRPSLRRIAAKLDSMLQHHQGD